MEREVGSMQKFMEMENPPYECITLSLHTMESPWNVLGKAPCLHK